MSIYDDFLGEISPDDFTKTLVEAAKTYTDDVVSKVEGGIDTIAAETLNEVQQLSPVKVHKHKKYKDRRYKQGWTVTKSKNRGTVKVVVHNKNYQLVHLLELGHCLRDGTGRVYGNVMPKKHIETAHKHAEEKIEKLLEEI